MNFLKIEQKSEEWWRYKTCKISGTRFGQAISSKENRLIYALLVEKKNNEPIVDNEYIDEGMQYGIDHEEYAIDNYSSMVGMEFVRGGVIASDFSKIHMSSPDAHNADVPTHVIVVETKCTMDETIQIKRFFTGIDSTYLPQIKNYFACSDDIKEVHFVSYCGMCSERPIVAFVVKREDVMTPDDFKNRFVIQMPLAEIEKGRKAILKIEAGLDAMMNDFIPEEMKF